MKIYIQFLILLIVFLFMSALLKYAYVFIQGHSHLRILNLKEYLPYEEIQTLKQVTYLILMTLVMIDILYQIIAYGSDIIYFVVFDIALSLFIMVTLRLNSNKNYLLLFGLIPFDSIFYLVSESYSWFIYLLAAVHFLVLLYMIRYYYLRFMDYTKSNGLGYTILLLFSIIFVSFLFTSFVEQVNLLDSLVMVSNAFTSNGYTVLGNSLFGKINSIFLVWSGYILSGVGTATLTAAIMIKYYNRRFNELEELIRDLKK